VIRLLRQDRKGIDLAPFFVKDWKVRSLLGDAMRRRPDLAVPDHAIEAFVSFLNINIAAYLRQQPIDRAARWVNLVE
jgi:hypothetical protein